MEEGRLPYSADTLKVDRAVAEFKAQADSLFIKPFNEDKWSSS